jgi:hypothetical protein
MKIFNEKENEVLDNFWFYLLDLYSEMSKSNYAENDLIKFDL